MKTKTQLKSGEWSLQHNETRAQRLTVKTSVKAGFPACDGGAK
jgi:hypothetical protein